jgi:hypothetical protein
MTWMEHSAKWRRQATALVCALALVLHIALMALGTMGPPASGSGAARVHAHHAASAAGHNAGSPTGSPGREPPCCILSICPGLPGPPLDHVLAFLPGREAHAAVYGAARPTAVPRIPQLLPVGSRAPPALA